MPALVAGISFRNTALFNKTAGNKSGRVEEYPRYLCDAGFGDDDAGL